MPLTKNQYETVSRIILEVFGEEELERTKTISDILDLCISIIHDMIGNWNEIPEDYIKSSIEDISNIILKSDKNFIKLKAENPSWPSPILFFTLLSKYPSINKYKEVKEFYDELANEMFLRDLIEVIQNMILVNFKYLEEDKNALNAFKTTPLYIFIDKLYVFYTRSELILIEFK